MPALSRRRMLQALGWSAAGIVVMGGSVAAAFPVLPYRGAPTEADAAAWLSLRPDGTVEIWSPRVEIGQGIAVALRQIVAEETGLPLDRVRTVSPDTALIPLARATVGSDSIRDFGPLLARAAAALANEMRLRAAARLDVSVDSVMADEKGLRAGGRSVSYAGLAGDDLLVVNEQALAAAQPRALSPGTPKRTIGRAATDGALVDIVTGGEPVFVDDVRLPGMLFGAVIRADRIGGEVAAIDDSACHAVSGYVGLFRDSGFAGIVAETRGALLRARDALEVRESGPGDYDDAAIVAAMNVDVGLAEGPLQHVLLDDAMDPGADWDIDLHLEVPMAAHAAMEARTAVAMFDDAGRLEIWTGSQDVFFARDHVANEMGIDRDDVTVHGMRVGGAFGGRTICNVELEAARLAKVTGRPVKVQWSRREEFAAAFHRPPSCHRIRARLADDGSIAEWWHAFRSGHVIFTSAAMGPLLRFATSFVADPGVARGSLPPYAARRARVEFDDVRMPVPTGPWRGLGAAPNSWAIETAIDALARSAGRDPVDFRMSAIAADKPRLMAVLREVAGLADWKQRVSTPRRGYGVACGIYKEMSYAAVIAEVTMQNEGTATVSHLWCAHDCGLVINPDRVRAQIEGNLVWGIGMVLRERLGVEAGRITADSQSDYALPRYADVPDIDISLIGGENAPTGAGETAIVAAGGAVANAIAAATGKAVIRLPYVV
jgi:isoquinoline 1-oxidoreductase beta subunit